MKNKIRETQAREMSVFFLAAVEKRSQVEIARILQIHRNTVSRYLSHFRKQLQKEKEKITNIDIVFFYENEMKELMKRREEAKSHHIYLAYTKMIVELQEKIAEYLKLKQVLHIQHEHSGNVEVNITNIVKNVVTERAEEIHSDDSPASRNLFLPNPED